MRAVVQRVSLARVRVDGAVVGEIGRGLCALVGVSRDDLAGDADALAARVVGLRVFEGADGRMAHDLAAVGGALLAVSQFTLLGDLRGGRRPSFTEAMPPAEAEVLFDRFVAAARAAGAKVETGRFRTHMEVELVNDGPVTLLLDTKRAF